MLTFLSCICCKIEPENSRQCRLKQFLKAVGYILMLAVTTKLDGLGDVTSFHHLL